MIIIEISSNRVVEALDILIHSLVDPLMLSDAIVDQMKILDDESSIAQLDDHYRITRLLTSLARRDHPITQFSWGNYSSIIIHFIHHQNNCTGNKESLKELMEDQTGTSVLKQFVQERYCVPEGMNLVMISNGKMIEWNHEMIERDRLDSIRIMQQRIERLFCLMKRRYSL